jgi:hypothetical protein
MMNVPPSATDATRVDARVAGATSRDERPPPISTGARMEPPLCHRSVPRHRRQRGRLGRSPVRCRPWRVVVGPCVTGPWRAGQSLQLAQWTVQRGGRGGQAEPVSVSALATSPSQDVQLSGAAGRGRIAPGARPLTRRDSGPGPVDPSDLKSALAPTFTMRANYKTNHS